MNKYYPLYKAPLSRLLGTCCLAVICYGPFAAKASENSGESSPIQVFPVDHYVEPYTGSSKSITIRKSIPTTVDLQGDAKNVKKSSTVMKTISVYDLGVLQFSIHDLFRVNRETLVDSENRKLDLSQLLDNGPEQIAEGGDPRNKGNVIVFTIAKQFGAMYLGLVQSGMNPEIARKTTIKKYLKDLKVAYENTFDEPFPSPSPYPIDQTGNLALRTLHDLNPGWLKVGGNMSSLLDLSLVASGKTLLPKELKQRSSTLDGRYYEGFRNMTAFNSHTNELEQIDLLERDASLATQFNTAFQYDHFLSELRDGHYNKNDDVLKEIRKVYANGQMKN